MASHEPDLLIMSSQTSEPSSQATHLHINSPAFFKHVKILQISVFQGGICGRNQWGGFEASGEIYVKSAEFFIRGGGGSRRSFFNSRGE